MVSFVSVETASESGGELKLGQRRQELLYGKQRIISPLDWANTRRRFDGVKLFYTDESLDADFFYVRPIPIDLSEGLNRKPDKYREEQQFHGSYGTYKGIPRRYVDLYILGLHDTGDLRNANGSVAEFPLPRDVRYRLRMGDEQKTLIAAIDCLDRLLVAPVLPE